MVTRSDRERGRTDSAEELRNSLPAAPAAYLEGAAENPELDEDGRLALVKNRQAPAALLGRLGRNFRWTRAYEVKAALVRHPQTPYAVARGLLSHLFWRDLLDTSTDPRISPVLRREAESLLRIRLPELALGEKVALARRAGRGLVPTLAEAGESPVLRALLGNSRLVERDVVRIASEPSTPPDVLAALASHHAWGVRRDVRMAVLGNPRTPVAAALGLVERIPERDLGRLAGEGGAPRIVKVGAARRLERGRSRARPPGIG